MDKESGGNREDGDRKYTEEKLHELVNICSVAVLDFICSGVLTSQAVTKLQL